MKSTFTNRKATAASLILRYPANAGLLSVLLALATGCRETTSPVAESNSPPPGVILLEGDDLQGAIDRARPGDTIVADPGTEVVVTRTVVIDKPLTLIGLRARTHPDVDGVPILEVVSEGFRIADFHLTGNAETGFSERASNLLIRAGNFIVERGVVEWATQHGISVRADFADPTAPDVRGGVIRDIIGRDNERDHVSLSGGGNVRVYIRDVVIERIRGYRSTNRGSVEIADGNDNIIVRDIYAEDCRYGVDLQDHIGRGGEMAQSNTGILVENVFVRRCAHAVRASTTDMGHRNHVIRNITGTEWEDYAIPLMINHARNVLIDTVRIDGNGEPIYAGVLLLNSGNVTAREITIDGPTVLREAILIENTTDVRLTGAYINALARESDGVAVRYRLQEPGDYRNLLIRDITAPGPANRIILEASVPETRHRPYHARLFTGEGIRYTEAPEPRGRLSDYRIHYDPNLVDDRLRGPNSRIIHQ